VAELPAVAAPTYAAAARPLDDTVVDDRLPEGRPCRRALAHHLESALGHPEGAHSVGDPARPQTLLGDAEAVALLAEQFVAGTRVDPRGTSFGSTVGRRGPNVSRRS
jgi:hypothetical protein